MKQPHKAGHPIANDPNSDWHVFGEFELLTGVDTRSGVKAWLLETLAPLDLHVAFLNKVLKSANESAMHVLYSETLIENQPIRFLIYIPLYHPVNTQTWGFFRIEKVEIAAKNEISPVHTVEFYLYLEGQ